MVQKESLTRFNSNTFSVATGYTTIVETTSLLANWHRMLTPWKEIFNSSHLLHPRLSLSRIAMDEILNGATEDWNSQFQILLRHHLTSKMLPSLSQ